MGRSVSPWQQAALAEDASIFDYDAHYDANAAGRGLHSSTFRLNWCALCGIGGASRDCVARVRGVCRVCRVFVCVRHCSS